MARPSTSHGAAGKKEIDVIMKVNSDDDLLSALNGSDALCIVDMYPHFCGPCDPMTSVFKRIKVDYGDTVSFLQAQTDAISYFAGMRDKSMPCFTLWVRGVLVGIVKGSNAPVMERMIKEQTEMSKITKDRKPYIPDIDIPQMIRPGIEFTPGNTALRMSTTVSTASVADDNFTVSIVKPDAVQPHIVAEVVAAAHRSHFTIAKARKLWLSDATARALYAEHEHKPFFGELLDYMTSGPALVLLLTRDASALAAAAESSGDTSPTDSPDPNATPAAWRAVVGPASPKHAQEVAPQSLRAQFGRDGLHNALHASDSAASARREMDLLFSPSVPALPYTLPSASAAGNDAGISAEQTVVVIGPRAAADPAAVELVVHRVLFWGLEIVKRAPVVMSRDEAAEWLQVTVPSNSPSSSPTGEANGHGESPDADAEAEASATETSAALSLWSSGPSLALVIRGADAVSRAKEMVHGDHPRALARSVPLPLYVAETAEAALRDAARMLQSRPISSMPNVRGPTRERTLALIKPDAYPKRDEIIAAIEVRGFKVVAKHMDLRLDPAVAGEFYRDHLGKPFYEELVEWMASGPIVALVLEKENAVVAWRDAMGPTNAIKAREIAADTLRALYGTDGSKNALHGSDSPLNAVREIGLLFDPTLSVVPESRGGSRMPSRTTSLVHLGMIGSAGGATDAHDVTAATGAVATGSAHPSRPTSSSTKPHHPSPAAAPAGHAGGGPSRPTSGAPRSTSPKPTRPSSSAAAGTAGATLKPSRPGSSAASGAAAPSKPGSAGASSLRKSRAKLDGSKASSLGLASGATPTAPVPSSDASPVAGADGNAAV
ncbi:nucleoside diphosphate kinase [Blastocladiella britannica]|nr:nucleoside diphosphate kinase [Blastocladiella britannica]